MKKFTVFPNPYDFLDILEYAEKIVAVRENGKSKTNVNTDGNTDSAIPSNAAWETGLL